jgi:ribonuclease J
LRDRKVLAEEGVVVVVVVIDRATGEVVGSPEVITRGWVYAPEAEELLDEASQRVRTSVEKAFSNGQKNIEALEREVRKVVGKFVSERTKRRPMIVPMVIET